MEGIEGAWGGSKETRYGKHWLNQEPALSTCLLFSFSPLEQLLVTPSFTVLSSFSQTLIVET